MTLDQQLDILSQQMAQAAVAGDLALLQQLFEQGQQLLDTAESIVA